jgi:heme/copper-type cytochrome/quinol oxidase subunit 2
LIDLSYLLQSTPGAPDPTEEIGVDTWWIWVVVAGVVAFCVLLTCALVLLYFYTNKRKLQTRARAKTNVEAKAKFRRGLSVR